MTRWKNEAVTDGGCLRSSTSTGSFDDRHMMCSAHTLCEQHSLSEQSIIPSDKKRDFFEIYLNKIFNGMTFGFFGFPGKNLRKLLKNLKKLKKGKQFKIILSVKNKKIKNLPVKI